MAEDLELREFKAWGKTEALVGVDLLDWNLKRKHLRKPLRLSGNFSGARHGQESSTEGLFQESSTVYVEK